MYSFNLLYSDLIVLFLKMFFQKKFVTETCYIGSWPNTTIKFGRNNEFEFTIIPKLFFDKSYIFNVVHQKGDFEIIKITRKSSPFHAHYELRYNEQQKTFNYCYHNDEFHVGIEFEILANVEYKKFNSVKDSYQLKFPSESLKMMDLYEFDETEIILPKHNYLKFNCYFKKHENDVIEVHIVNPYNLKINGKLFFVKKNISNLFCIFRQ